MAELRYPDPELTDALVTLRPWEDIDLECVRAGAGDPEIRRWTSVPEPYSEEAGIAYLARQRWRRIDGAGLSLALTRAHDRRAVGQVWLGVRPQPGVIGLGYWVIPAARRHGVASRAARLAADWALGPGGADRIEAWVVPDNVASLRVLASAGFEREGLLRSFLAERETGTRFDAVVLSRIRAA